VGSNDLCRLDKSVQEIEQKWIGLVLTLQYFYHVQRVAVLQILHRQWPRRRIRYPVNIPWFNDRVDTLNTLDIEWKEYSFGDTTAIGAQKIKNWLIQMIRCI
jgi:hypothetical protein